MKAASKLVASLCLLGIASCDPAPGTSSKAEPQAEERPRFEGMLVAGTPDDAKASGFTECVAEGNGYYGYTCARPETTLLGVKPIRTFVRLTYPIDYPHDAERTPAKTAYDDITYHFPEAKESLPDCDYNLDNPYSCYDASEPLPSLARSLREQGWMGRHTRYGFEYVKPEEPFEISINTRKVNAEWGTDNNREKLVVEVKVTPLAADELAALLEARQATQRARQTAQDTNASFIDRMKNGRE